VVLNRGKCWILLYLLVGINKRQGCLKITVCLINGYVKCLLFVLIKPNGVPSDVMKKVQVPILPETVCEQTEWPRDLKFTSRNICAGKVFGSDSCKGDSGGPLIYRYLAISAYQVNY
jgi:hypothetical protein